MANKPILGYWDIRGLAGYIRLLLEHVGVDYEDKLYQCGPPPTFDRQEWLDDKFNLGLQFPNLPYYIDGDVKLTQSLVILHYLARKHGLVPKSDSDLLRAELIEAQIKDIHMEFIRAFYNPDFSNAIKPVHENAPAKLKQVAEFLGDRDFFVGYLTYVDFLVFEVFEALHAFDSKLIENEPKLEAFRKRVLALPNIDKYFKSDRAIKFPFNGAPARWGGKYSDIINKQQ